MGIKKKKQYQLLHLPSARYVEVLAPKLRRTPENKLINFGEFEWHVLVKNRSDLKTILNRIIAREFPPTFFAHNEITPFQVKSCHFVFIRVQTPTESK